MTHDEMIDVIKHHQKGGLLESRPRHCGGGWSPVSIPNWTFDRFEYRPMKVPVVVWGIVWSDGKVSPCFFKERAGAEDYAGAFCTARVVKLVEVEE